MEKKFIAVGKKAKVINNSNVCFEKGEVVEIMESNRLKTGGSFDYYVKNENDITDLCNHEDLEEIVTMPAAPAYQESVPAPTPKKKTAAPVDPRVEYLNKIQYGKSYFIREVIEQSVEVVKIGNEIYKRESNGTYTPFFGKLDLNYTPMDSSEIPF